MQPVYSTHTGSTFLIVSTVFSGVAKPLLQGGGVYM